MAELSLNIFVQPWESWVGVNYIHICLILHPSWTEISSVCGIFVVSLKSQQLKLVLVR